MNKLVTKADTFASALCGMVGGFVSILLGNRIDQIEYWLVMFIVASVLLGIYTYLRSRESHMHKSDEDQRNDLN